MTDWSVLRWNYRLKKLRKKRCISWQPRRKRTMSQCACWLKSVHAANDFVRRHRRRLPTRVTVYTTACDGDPTSSSYGDRQKSYVYDSDNWINIHLYEGPFCAKAHKRARAILRAFIARDTRLLMRAFLVYVPLLDVILSFRHHLYRSRHWGSRSRCSDVSLNDSQARRSYPTVNV